MAFKKVGSLDPHGAPVLKRAIITNSVVTTQLDSVKVASGFIALGTAGAEVFGHVLAHSTEEGVGLNTSGATGADIGSYAGTYTAASDNQTVAKVKVECDISKNSIYSEPTSGTLGTTTGSNLLGYYLDLTDEDTLDETSATATPTAQYFNWGLNAENSAQIDVNIVESSVFGGAES